MGERGREGHLGFRIWDFRGKGGGSGRRLDVILRLPLRRDTAEGSLAPFLQDHRLRFFKGSASERSSE
jgi:hypothetical protein